MVNKFVWKALDSHATVIIKNNHLLFLRAYLVSGIVLKTLGWGEGGEMN